MFCNSNVNNFFLVSRDREIITVKSLKNKRKKLALTLFYYASREIWLGNSKKLICMDQSRFYIFTPARIQKCFTQLRNILAFLTINHQQAESCIYQRIFLQVILVPIIVPWQYIFLHVTLNCRTILQLCCIFTLILSFGRGDCVFLSYLLPKNIWLRVLQHVA